MPISKPANLFNHTHGVRNSTRQRFDDAQGPYLEIAGRAAFFYSTSRKNSTTLQPP